jgi:putative hydrolases of HD superfamily
LLLGVREPESVADHSFRVAIIGMILAAIEGADVGHTAALCIMHDTPESRVGDIPNVGRAYVNTAKPEAVSSHQTAGMPEALAGMVQQLVQEYDIENTVESRLARDPDKIETLLQAREYRVQGSYNTEPWEETSLTNLRTDAGKQVAQAATEADAEEWWRAFAQTYHELRRSSRGAR